MDDMEKARNAIESWYLGKTSAKQESNGYGPTTISTGKGDHGGASYGVYQLSSRMGTLQKYLEQSRYKDEFIGLEPVTPAFDAKWRELANSDPEFGEDQHDFIRRTHYDAQVAKLENAGVDLSEHGRSVHDALWSTSVQFGSQIGSNVFQRGLEERFGKEYDLSTLSDQDIVEAVQDYKYSHNSELFRSSSPQWPGLLKRAQEEKSELIALAAHEQLLAKNGVNIPIDLSAGMVNHDVPAQHRAPRRVAAPATQQLQETLNTLGYTDVHGHALVADGHNGRHTREAIQAFQRDHGLHVDGIAGPVTLAAVREAVVHIPSIGQPDAPYLHHPQQTDALADYRAFAPVTVPHFTSVSPTAVTGVEPPSITFPTVSASLDAPAVRHLQENLNALGMTNHRGQALPVTGDYDTQTRMAVMGFQAEQNLPATGQPDQATVALIQAHATIAQLQQLGAERAVPSREAPSLAPTLPYVPQDTPPVVSQARAIPPAGLGHAPNDPRHPGSAEHALYNDLKERFPDASENRLLQFTAACHVNNITAQNLNAVRFDQQGGFVHFAATGDLVAKVASVDVKEPSPQPQQSIQHMQQYDQEQAQMFARIREQNAQINAQAQQGPVLGGR